MTWRVGSNAGSGWQAASSCPAEVLSSPNRHNVLSASPDELSPSLTLARVAAPKLLNSEIDPAWSRSVYLSPICDTRSRPLSRVARDTRAAR
jgi:hypothetical protein